MQGQHRVVRNSEQLQFAIQQVKATAFPFQLKVSEVVSPKTAKQIRYAHSLCNALAAYKQASPESAKKDAKAEFGVVIVCNSLVTGNRTARLKSFADYSRDEMEAFITGMEAYLCSESIPFTEAA